MVFSSLIRRRFGMALGHIFLPAFHMSRTSSSVCKMYSSSAAGMNSSLFVYLESRSSWIPAASQSSSSARCGPGNSSCSLFPRYIAFHGDKLVLETFPQVAVDIRITNSCILQDPTCLGSGKCFGGGSGSHCTSSSVDASTTALGGGIARATP